MASDITFLDTECLGLALDAPIWEFAAVRRSYNYDSDDPTSYIETSSHCFIEHRRSPWLGQMPDEFKVDYLRRFNNPIYDIPVLSRRDAVKMIDTATSGAHIVGAVPNFDTERIARLMRREHVLSSWHYHLIDVENLAVGWLAAHKKLMPPPWKSDELSRAIGVDPEQFQRHTAMGDVEWVRAQYDAVMGVPKAGRR